VLIIKPSSLGDIVHGLQVAQSLADQRPETEIDWVARDIFALLPAHAECVREVIVFQRKRGLRGVFEVCRDLRARRYDYVMDMQGLARSGFMTLSARACRKRGRADGREGAPLFYTPVPMPEGGRKAHALDILRQFLPEVGAAAIPGRPLRFRDLPDIATIDARLAAGARPMVLIPHSRGEGKEWPHFEELAGRMLDALPGVPLVWDSHRPTPTRWDSHPSFVNTSGKTGLPAMTALLRSARLVVANDSGPMHLAAALKIPVLALFGRTSPERFGPHPASDPMNQSLRGLGNDINALTVDAVLAKAGEMVKAEATRVNSKI